MTFTFFRAKIKEVGLNTTKIEERDEFQRGHLIGQTTRTDNPNRQPNRQPEQTMPGGRLAELKILKINSGTKCPAHNPLTTQTDTPNRERIPKRLTKGTISIDFYIF